VGIVALRDGEIRIVQSSMLGSILSDTLLVSFLLFVLIRFLLIDGHLGSWQLHVLGWLRQTKPEVQQDCGEHDVFSNNSCVRVSDRASGPILHLCLIERLGI
jgi:hypothetical protein